MSAVRDQARVRLALVDDSEVVRAGLKALLGMEPAIEIVGEGGSVAQGIDLIARLKPQVVLLDIRLPDGNGFTACREMLKRSPETRVLMLTSTADEAMVDEAI
ncbi:MAG: response regulator transcription factor, partial [Opitutaceae bacterium]